jgi:PAS domain S-box-containing protein
MMNPSPARAESDLAARRIAELEAELEAARAALRDDVRTREAAEAARRHTEERVRALLDRMAYGMYRSTLDGRFVEVNHALIAMLGYDSAEELLRVDIARDVYRDADDRARLVQSFGMPGADVTRWVEVRWKRRDGTPLTVRLTARAVREGERKDGLPAFFDVIVEDVTERKRQEELLRRSERMASLGHTLAGVAHELNNPLAAIRGFAQLLLRDEWPAEERSALETIDHEAARAAKIVKDLLLFARRQEGRPRERVDLNRLVGYITDSQRYTLETRGIRVVLELAPQVPPLLADAAQLEQVVLNLVTNARQALESQVDDAGPGAARRGAAPEITVSTAVEDGHVLLEVRDNGPGIPEAARSRIWDPFFTTKPEGEGTGLGLSVVHGIVAAHGGSTDLETELGTGTAVRVALPLPHDAEHDADADAPVEVGRAEGAPTAQRPLDILVVESDPASLGFLTRYFTSRGHAVMAAADAAQAVRIAERAPFDVVMAPARLPGVGGANVVQALRSLATCAGSRFVLSTGEGEREPAHRMAEQGQVAAVIERPYEIEELRRAVEG